TGVKLSGRVTLASGTLTVAGEVPVTAGASFTQSGGTLAGTGTLTVSGSYTWSGGSQTEKGKTVIANGATLSIDSSTSQLSLTTERTLEIQSGATAGWTGSNVLRSEERRVGKEGSTFNAKGESKKKLNDRTEPLIHNAKGTTMRSEGSDGHDIA